MDGQYDVAQICPNGHLANFWSRKYPQANQEYCSKCGEKTLVACPDCSRPIRGKHHDDWANMDFTVPAFCQYCGRSFPWTERKAHAALELFTEDAGPTPEQAKEFEESLQEVVRDTPRTPVAAGRIGRALKKVTAPVGNAIRDILVDIVSETAKKTIWPGNP